MRKVLRGVVRQGGGGKGSKIEEGVRLNAKPVKCWHTCKGVPLFYSKIVKISLHLRSVP